MTATPAAAHHSETGSLSRVQQELLGEIRGLFGLTVASNFPFTFPLPTGHGPVGLTISVQPSTLASLKQVVSRPAYASTRLGKGGLSIGFLYRETDEDILHFTDVADFRIRPGRIDVHVHQASRETGMAELYILGQVMSYWFERQGLLTFHSSGVFIEGRAIAFVSRHGGGKSGLAAALVSEGAQLVTDDVLVLDESEDNWMTRSSFPLMRMWPDEAEHFLGSYADLPRVQKDSEKRSVAVGEGGFGRFHETSSPLACIYLATRVEGADVVEIQPVPRSEALIELVRHSFSPRLVEAAGLQPARLDRLARLVRRVPVRRLVYPSGFERLEEVAATVLRDGAP